MFDEESDKGTSTTEKTPDKTVASEKEDDESESSNKETDDDDDEEENNEETDGLTRRLREDDLTRRLREYRRQHETSITNPRRLKRRRNNIVIDNGKEELTDRHLRSMKRDTSDIVMDVPSLSAWPRDKCATSTCCAADIYNTEREYNYDVIHPDLQKRLTTQQLLARPCIGDDGGLAPELLALWKRNTCKVTGRAGTQLPFRMRCRRSQRRRRRRRAEPSPKLKYGQRIMVPPAVGEQPIKAVVNSILPDDMYRVDYLDDNRYWGPKVWSYSQLIVGWPNEEDDAVDADEEEPTQFYRHQYRSKKYKHKVRQVQIDEEQDPDYTGFKVLRGGHDFDIARILEQSATRDSKK